MLAVAGCGHASLSETQLRTEAARLCAAARRQLDAVATPATPAEGAKFLATGIAVLEPELATLRLLRAPPGISRAYATAISAFSQKLADLQDARDGLAAGGDPVIVIKTLQARLGPAEQRENGAWQSLAIPACTNR
jgi:hypothetical protein